MWLVIWCLCFDAGLVREINFSLSLHPVAKEYGIAVRLSQDNRSKSGRCWRWLSGSWVCYATMALHWLLHTKKQNDARYSRLNHRCCKPCLCRVLILWQYSIPDGGHRSCSALSWISSTQLQDGSRDPSRISKGLCRNRPCLPHKRKGTWYIKGIHEWCPAFSSGFLPDFDKSHQCLAGRLRWHDFLLRVLLPLLYIHLLKPLPRLPLQCFLLHKRYQYSLTRYNRHCLQKKNRLLCRWFICCILIVTSMSLGFPRLRYSYESILYCHIHWP